MVCRVRCPIRLHVLSNHFAAISCPEVHALDGWGNRSGGPYVMVGLGTRLGVVGLKRTSFVLINISHAYLLSQI